MELVSVRAYSRDFWSLLCVLYLLNHRIVDLLVFIYRTDVLKGTQNGGALQLPYAHNLHSEYVIDGGGVDCLLNPNVCTYGIRCARTSLDLPLPRRPSHSQHA